MRVKENGIIFAQNIKNLNKCKYKSISHEFKK